MSGKPPDDVNNDGDDVTNQTIVTIDTVPEASVKGVEFHGKNFIICDSCNISISVSISINK